ncbi:hypothetical protein RYX36_027664, partial [Vicia faba]
MISDAKLVNTLVIEKCKEMFNELDSLVGVGGGTGTTTKAFAKSFPQLGGYCMTGMMRNVKKCKVAIAKKDEERKVIIIDMVVERDNENHEAFETQVFLNMLMM